MDACWAPVFCEYFKQSLDLSSLLPASLRPNYKSY